MPLARARRARLPVSASTSTTGCAGAEADADASTAERRFAQRSSARPAGADRGGAARAPVRRPRRAGLRATGHTASDQVETVLLRLLASGSTQRIKARREDGVVRPLLAVWREETRGVLRRARPLVRQDSTNAGPSARLIRRGCSAPRRVDPRARASLLSLADERPRLPRRLEGTLAALLADRTGRRRPTSAAACGRCASTTTCGSRAAFELGPWRIEWERAGLVVRARRPGDRLAGRAQEGAGSVRGREGAEGRASRAGQSSSAATGRRRAGNRGGAGLGRGRTATEGANERGTSSELEAASARS